MKLRARLGVIAAVLLVGLVLLLATAGRGSSRASTDRGPEGSAALAGVLHRLGYEVGSLRLGLHVLGRTPAGLLVLASPPGLVAWPPLTISDASHLIAWARAGGVIVALTDRQDPLLDALGVTVDVTARRRPSPGRPATAQPTRPTQWTRGPPLSLEGRAGFTGGVALPLYVADNAVVASLHPQGEGAIVIVADPALASNASLGRQGNLEFFARAAGFAMDGGAVWFDDLHAGGGDGHGVVAYARRAGAGGTLFLALLGLGLLLWRLSARQVPTRVLPSPDRALGTSEYVRGLGGLYARAGLSKHALAVTSRQFRAAIERRSGIAWERDALGRWLDEELGGEAPAEFHAVRAAFATLFAQPEPEPEHVLRAARLAADFEHRWLHRTASTLPIDAR